MFIGSLFVIFYLAGVYQLIGILNATEEEMKFAINSILFEKNRTNYTEIIEENYENYSFKNIPNFDIELFFLTSILGKIFLKRFGFRISSAFFMLINTGAIFLLSSFKIPENRYTFTKLLVLFLHYVLNYISVGCISLYPHQIYFEGLKKYYNNVDERNAENYSFFSYICYTVIPAYILHFLLNIYFEYYNYYNSFFITNIFIYNTLTFISLLIYCIYSAVFSLDSSMKLDSERTIYKIFGYLIYREKIIHENNSVKCRSCRIVLRKCHQQTYEQPISVFCPCCLSNCCKCTDSICCGCISSVELSDLYKENEELCYCYKVQKKLSWMTDS